MVLKWVWDDFGMIPRWFWDDFGMMLGWFWNDFGMVLEWCWYVFGMTWGWFWNDFSTSIQCTILPNPQKPFKTCGNLFMCIASLLWCLVAYLLKLGLNLHWLLAPKSITNRPKKSMKIGSKERSEKEPHAASHFSWIWGPFWVPKSIKNEKKNGTKKQSIF